MNTYRPVILLLSTYLILLPFKVWSGHEKRNAGPLGKADEDIKLTYEVVRNNKVIGMMHALKTQKGTFTEYQTESSVQVNLVLELTIYTKVVGVFRQGQLLSGSAIRKVNNSTRVNTIIKWQGNRYVVEDDGEKTEIIEKISYTTACLMHMEPAGLHRIFSEAYRKFIPIREIRPHYYELQLPDGNKNYYHYSNGICMGAEVNTNLSKAFFRLKK